MYGKKEDKKYILERIELDEGELPLLVPRTPMPRFKKVTLKELMSALNKAIETEGRRIRKDISSKQAAKLALSVMPRDNRVPLKDRVQELMSRITKYLKEIERTDLTFHELSPTREEKLTTFLPILHLNNNEKIYINQKEAFQDIFIRLDKQHELEDLELSEEFVEDLSKAELLEGDKLEQEEALELNELDSS